MRPLFGGIYAALAVLVGCGSAAAGAGSLVRKAQASPPAQTLTVACLGGVLNEEPTHDYLTVANYPAFAALAAGLRRIFICGDSIPPILPSSARAGFGSRRR